MPLKAPRLHLLAGSAKGLRLVVPPGTRPTESRVRAALFSIWEGRVEHASVLDLFAGSGAVGLEALSRGALRATLVEADPAARRALAANASRFPPGATEILALSLPDGLSRLVPARAGAFDLVFADPPYVFAGFATLLALAAPLLADGGELVVEHSSRRAPPDQAPALVRSDLRRYGESALSFYRRGEGVG